ncbi:Ig-like domain-containing protein, partial [Pseudooceanicola sp.]|uniref:Ig-like domain-containing protein n=1 Tax=Pseudooceanicola sp. TaxID=1914328 RepID=UPI002615E2F4
MAGYTDHDGDKIDSNDAILPGETGNDDIVDAGAGDDSIASLLGNDEVYAGGGSDTVAGGAGNDIIYGDSSLDTVTASSGTEVFEWDKLPDPNSSGSIDDNDPLSGVLIQDTGKVNVTFETISTSDTPSTTFSTDEQKVHSIETGTLPGADSSSSLESHLDSNGESATYRWSFSQNVNDVSFRINDIDYDSKVTIQAFDSHGNPVQITTTIGSEINGNDLDGSDGSITVEACPDSSGSDTDPNNSALVHITGDIAYFTVSHTQAGSEISQVNITDIYFDPIAAAADDEGNDSLDGEDGNDIIFGEGGDDTLLGGTGNDTLFGDYGVDGGATSTTRESFEWDKAPDYKGNAPADDGDKLAGFTQDTGNVDVKFSFTTNESPSTKFSTDQQAVDGVVGDSATVDANSSLESHLDSNNESASYKWEFSDEVSNVSFRVNDADYDSKVVVTAYDAAGNPTTVVATIGSELNGNDLNGADGQVTFEAQSGASGYDTSLENSALINIAGPVSYFTVEHIQNGSHASEINITDIFYDTSSEAVSKGNEGNDYIDGEDGDDVLYGEQGDDTLIGGEGADSAIGGDDQDLFIGGNVGDFVDGSEGGVDNDTLDLSTSGPLSVVYDNDNPENGTVTFFDGAGAATGTMRFINIENVILPTDEAPIVVDETATIDEDTTLENFDILTNDVDPEGAPVSLVGTPLAQHGTVTVNPDGTINYTPDADYNGSDTITYVVSDPGGNTSTGTVTVTVNPVDDAPVANPDTATTDEDTPVENIDVLGNDTDPDGQTLSIQGTPTADHGTVTVNPDGTLNYTPDADYNGADTITYVVTDPDGNTDTGTVAVTVNPADDAPTANPDTATTDEDTPVENID